MNLMKASGQGTFIKENQIVINGKRYLRCGAVNQFFRNRNIKPAHVYAMEWLNPSGADRGWHHYMLVKTFEYLVHSLYQRRRQESKLSTP